MYLLGELKCIPFGDQYIRVIEKILNSHIWDTIENKYGSKDIQYKGITIKKEEYLYPNEIRGKMIRIQVYDISIVSDLSNGYPNYNITSCLYTFEPVTRLPNRIEVKIIYNAFKEIELFFNNPDIQ